MIQQLPAKPCSHIENVRVYLDEISCYKINCISYSICVCVRVRARVCVKVGSSIVTTRKVRF